MHSLEQLNAFIAVFEKGSYSAAGRTLNKDRTTVRELIKSYEDILGFTLFTIQGRKAIPTDYGNGIYPQVKLVLRQNHQLDLYTKELFEHNLHELTFCFDSDFPSDFIRQIESKALEAYPEVRINWVQKHREQALDALESGDLDLVFLPTKYNLLPKQTILYKNIGYINYHFYVGSQSPLSSHEEITLEDTQLEIQYIAEHTVKTDGLIKPFSSHCRVVGSNELLLSLLELRGWAVLPDHIASKWEAEGRIIKKPSPLLVDDVKIPASVFFSASSQYNPIIAQILDWCSDIAEHYF
ncbi:LysR family transcriptional regulator [Vibrio mexicanus]|uniref:LysR family transcriptional regulator n=1 Tax=Vibrio mexicanus TaxID=1004326 RepID=UPI00063C58FE|nr:LysR family transcriptional regulator [Vibrio mexicanus]